MELKLVPMEGEKTISKEEKERRKKRAQPIPPEKLQGFSSTEQKEIKTFLAALVVLTEQYHHDMDQKAEHKENLDYYENHIEKLQADRQALFQNPTPAVEKFIKLLDLYAMEPWHEFELMIAGIRGDDLHHYYETKLKATVDQYHVRVEDDLDREQENRLLNEMKCRMTAKEIHDLVFFHPLEDLVRHLISGRQLISGEFWNVGLYDL